MPTRLTAEAELVMARCLELAQCTEEPGRITRTFLSPPMRRVHELVSGWMREVGLQVSIDAVGNIRGLRGPGARRLIIGSHLDTVPNAGAYDGILGVVMGIAMAKECSDVAVIGFSEEEGVKFGVPFIGSRAVVGTAGELVDARVAKAIREYGLDPARLPEARLTGAAYFEIHIEQGPVLEHHDLALGIVDAIAGQSRYAVTFHGSANHAGTTPMHLRNDALVRAANWILQVERCGRETEGLVATVGRCEVEPGAGNVIPGRVRASLDVRHKLDAIRRKAANELVQNLDAELLMDVPAMELDVTALADAVSQEGFAAFHLTSGAGHDAMVMAQAMPATMLFLRSPKGISHHPAEAVLVDDVEAALRCAKRFVRSWNG